MYKVTTFFLLGLLALACGFPTEQQVKEARINGGTDASPGDAPYQVSIRTPLNQHICAGSIVGPSTVVTLATCIKGRPESETRVVVGTIYLNSGGATYLVSQNKVHESYHPMGGTYNDIGVVITTIQIVTSPTVSIIPVRSTSVADGSPALLTGWGYTGNAEIHSNILQKVTVNTISLGQCNSITQANVFSGLLCTYKDSGEGGCPGDAGSPLVVGGELVGIFLTSWKCGASMPSIFTDALYYYDWIDDNIISL